MAAPVWTLFFRRRLRSLGKMGKLFFELEDGIDEDGETVWFAGQGRRK